MPRWRCATSRVLGLQQTYIFSLHDLFSYFDNFFFNFSGELFIILGNSERKKCKMFALFKDSERALEKKRNNRWYLTPKTNSISMTYGPCFRATGVATNPKHFRDCSNSYPNCKNSTNNLSFSYYINNSYIIWFMKALLHSC